MQEGYVKYVKRAANLAILVAGILILIKALAWWQTGSVTLLATMTDSLVDLLASLTNVLVLRFALRPADDEHRFGHGKAESLAALAQSAFIAGSAVFLLLHGFQRLAEPVDLNNGEFGLAISVISIALTAFLVWYQHRVVKITQSPAIAADSLHYKTDLLMNVAIMMALGLNMLGFVYADALFAIGISFYILFSAIKMQWEASQTLLDHALPAEEVAQINQIAQDAPNVIGVHDVWTRRVGVVRFIQLHLELDDSLTLLEAHDIADQLENRILAAFPQAEIIIHQEPTSVVQREKLVNSN